MKLCECGCGEPAPIAKETTGGYKKGEAKRFVANHHRRGATFSSQHRARISKASRGKPKTVAHRQKMSANMRGKWVGPDHPGWRGEDASYHAIHAWLARNHPKAGKCEQCEREAPTEYSLIHGRPYSRERADYRELCVRCHRRYDLAGRKRVNPAPLRLAGDIGSMAA